MHKVGGGLGFDSPRFAVGGLVCVPFACCQSRWGNWKMHHFHIDDFHDHDSFCL